MSTTPPQPEPWLRGPIAGIPASVDSRSLLRPIAHVFTAAVEDVERAVGGMSADDLWARPGGVAPPGFHLCHLAGATDRLLTYARGESLSESMVLGPVGFDARC